MMISFEVLDQGKTANKSNKTKNPNVQKIANHQPLSELFGLVAVTNAEKVILDRIQEKNGQISLFEESEDEKDRQANEFRNLIGKLPSLSIFIDEVHHAVSDEIKLRAVVTKWAENNTINSVIDFSGTPYLEKAEKFKIIDSLSVGTAEITNIVYYYPLIDGVGNFLKRPIVKIADITDSSLIIEKGVREFLDTYKDTVYAGGLTAKLGIYCGTIEKLEETVYPLVSRIATEYGISAETILKFHKGNKQYKISFDSQLKIDTKVAQMIALAEETGNTVIAEALRKQHSSHPQKDRSFHYLPYHTDSSYEQTFLKEVLSFDEIANLGLEVYYNGDRAMTEFKIKCYKQNGSKWSYVGIYTPDFLIIKRKDGKIHKIIVVETKGEIYAKDPTFRDKKIFMETEFSKQNNVAYGYERFDYLYLEDILSEKERLTLTHQKICEFFKEGQE